MDQTPEGNLDERRNLVLTNLTAIFYDDDDDNDPTDIVANCGEPKNAESQEYTNPEIESGLINYRIENENNCFGRLENFNKKMIKKLFDRSYSLKELKKSLSAVIKTLYLNEITLNDFLDTIEKKESRVQYFMDKGLPEKDAFACALALSFYTGLPNKTRALGEIGDRNMQFNRLAKKGETSSHYLVIMSFLFKALSHIPTYSGSCIRAVDLNDEEKEMYKPGSIVNWRNFSSSSKGDKPAASFSGKNTYFIIQSLTGRSIVQFSNFPEEDEILFHLFSTFFVVKKEVRNDKTLIYLRQTELGMSDQTILWVDDKIFSENWEHKPFYDRFCGYAHQYGVRVIPKSSTAQAQSFLESPFGKFNMTNSKNFQVITNMRRPNEKQGNKAGLNFANWLKDKKYHLDLAMFDPKVSVGDYASIRNSSELGSYLHDRIRINYMFWNCPINDDMTLNSTEGETPLAEENEADENQTPNGEIFIATTLEAAEILPHHYTPTSEAAEAMHHETPDGPFNNVPVTPTSEDGEVVHHQTPGFVDCSQEAAKIFMIDEERQRIEGGYDSNAANFNLLVE